MKSDQAVPTRRGPAARIRAATAGLLLLAFATIAARSGWSSGARIQLGLSGDGSVEGDEAEPVVVDDEPDPVAPAPAPRGRGTAILASMSRPEGAALSPRPEPRRAMAIEIDRAKGAMAACRARYESIRDYSCVFHKRERIDGKLINPHIMAMKVRTRPHALYFKFVQPNRGREAIFEPTKYDGKVVAHDVGLGRLLAGTMYLDPRGTMAMEESRHPVTEAGIGALIRTVIERWDAELDPDESSVAIHPHAKVGDRACTMIETVHPGRKEGFLFHRVKVFVDHEQGLPIRFEAYDWPKQAGGEADLVEEYTYADLKTDSGLEPADFDPANPRYSFRRF